MLSRYLDSKRSSLKTYVSVLAPDQAFFKSLFFSADIGNDLALVQTRPVKAFETYVAFSAELELSLEDS